MVSKLALAAQEVLWESIHNQSDSKLIESLRQHYYAVVDGIGAHKTPKAYGAIPTDPYSHTPAGRGAQQPGMTGQVKEDILCRWGEFGVYAQGGELFFNPTIVRTEEYLEEEKGFEFYDVKNQKQLLTIPKNALCFTYCQVPIVYHKASNSKGIELVLPMENKRKLTNTIFILLRQQISLAEMEKFLKSTFISHEPIPNKPTDYIIYGKCISSYDKLLTFTTRRPTAADILGNPNYQAISYGGYRTTSRDTVPTVDQIKDDMRILSAMDVKIFVPIIQSWLNCPIC